MIKKWGITTIKLDKQNHYGQKENAQKANYKAIIKEAKDRCGSDPDIDHSKSKENILFVGSEFDAFLNYRRKFTGDDLIAYYDSLIEQHRDARGHKFRKDGIIAGAAIIKPAIDDNEWKMMTNDQKEAFLSESINGFMRSFKDKAVKFDSAIIHFDEQNPHIHIFYHDEAFNLAHKVGLKFREELHRGEFVSYMSKKGFELMPHGKSQKKGGKSSLKYKAEKEAERIREEAMKEAEQIRQAAEQEQGTTAQPSQVIRQILSEQEQEKAAHEKSDRIIPDANEENNRITTEGKQENTTPVSESRRLKNTFVVNQSVKLSQIINKLRKPEDSFPSDKQLSELSKNLDNQSSMGQNINQPKEYAEFYEKMKIER